MKTLLCIFLSLYTLSCNALDCPPKEVDQVQSEASGNLLVRLKDQNWHSLGNASSPGVREMFSIILSAQAQGKLVVIRYPDGYDCNAYDIATPAQMVRLYN